MLAAVLAVAVAAPTAARPFCLDDLASIVRLSEPQISPDGRRVALLVGRANLDENRYDTALVLVETASGASRALVSERAGLLSPRFSPRGDRLAFVARDASGTSQVHVLPLDGGEARAVTRSATGIDAYAWSPDGGRLAWVAPEETPRREGAARFEDGFEVGHDSLLTRSAPQPSQLHVVDVASGVARRVTSGRFSLATGLGATALSFSPDGREVVLTRFDSPSSGDADRSRIAVVDLESGSLRDLTGRSRHESGAAFSPDGTRIAFLHPRDGDPASLIEAFVAPSSGGPGQSRTSALDRNLLWLLWRPDGESLLAGGNDTTRSGLWELPPRGEARRIDLDPVVEVSDLSQAAAGALALVGSEEGRPEELYVVERAGAPPRRLTAFGDAIAGLSLGRSERISWRTEDGFAPDGVLTFPPEFDPKRKYPLVLYVHGGPTAASTSAFSDLAQLMAARGWLVLQPNYRGSDNLGDRHLRGIVAGAGSGPGRDLLAGVEAVKARGYVDASRLAVSGWSYGGFMTGWMIGRYPALWRAAVAGAAALDLFDMYALSDLNVMPRHFITGSPWTGGREESFRTESPLRFASSVRTPTLILSSVGDSRVTATQSYKLFRALEDNGVETKFVAYPTEGHWPAGPVRRRDIYRRWLDWIEDKFRR
jgi:dipeptidyl aminopeptidase/acylaminoacyl peptidase